jgi:hypothetical protein
MDGLLVRILTSAAMSVLTVGLCLLIIFQGTHGTPDWIGRLLLASAITGPICMALFDRNVESEA